MSHPGAPAELEAGNLALEFLNTLRLRDGSVVDTVASPRDLMEWLASRGLLTEEALHGIAASPPDARLLLGEAQRLRSAVGQGVEAFAGHVDLPITLLTVLNRCLAGRRTSQRAEQQGMAIELVRVTEPATVPGLLALIAEAAVELFAGDDPARVRQCHADDCRLWFLDGSKNGSRKWCSMARCGNRAKVAAHYRRKESG